MRPCFLQRKRNYKRKKNSLRKLIIVIVIKIYYIIEFNNQNRAVRVLYYIYAGPPKIRLYIKLSTRISTNRYRILTSAVLNFTLYRSIFIVLHYDTTCYFI